MFCSPSHPSYATHFNTNYSWQHLPQHFNIILHLQLLQSCSEQFMLPFLVLPKTKSHTKDDTVAVAANGFSFPHCFPLFN